MRHHAWPKLLFHSDHISTPFSYRILNMSFQSLKTECSKNFEYIYKIIQYWGNNTIQYLFLLHLPNIFPTPKTKDYIMTAKKIFNNSRWNFTEVIMIANKLIPKNSDYMGEFHKVNDNNQIFRNAFACNYYLLCKLSVVVADSVEVI